jgi:transcription factor C subunit 7
MTRKKDASNILGGWEAIRLADGSHLKEGPARDWGFEDIEIEHGKVSQSNLFPAGM